MNAFKTDNFNRIIYPLGLKPILKALIKESLADAGYLQKRHFGTYIKWSGAWISSGRLDIPKGNLILSVNASWYEGEEETKIRFAKSSSWKKETFMFYFSAADIREVKLKSIL